MGIIQGAVRNRFVEVDSLYSSVFYIAGYESGINDDKGRVGTASGSAGVSTTYARFGSQSLALPNDGSRVTYARTADMDIGPGNLTMEFSCLVPPGLSGAFRFLFGRPNLWFIGLEGLGGGQCRFQWYTGGVLRVSSAAVDFSTAHDVALVRNGGIAFFYLNGGRNVQDFDSFDLSSPTEPLIFGDVSGFAQGAAGCRLDEVRLTAGAARMTAATYTLRTTDPFPRQ